ncbi:MAG: AAA family ATPase, partial [Spirochaetota bacterium]|nr:AAA family ATPase [Spirochaetota bacterium]
EYIIGQKEPVIALAPGDSQARFNSVFSHFIYTLSETCFPLVIFLDDLQWIDSASIHLLKSVLINFEDNPFLIIGAYRESDVDLNHTLYDMIHDFNAINAKDQLNINMNHILLKPFHPNEIKSLLNDSFALKDDILEQLSVIIADKTLGNPFYVKQYIQTMFEENIFSFDRIKKSWQVSMEGVSQSSLTENVVDFMIKRLSNLSSEAQRLLKLASCVGSFFDSKTLTSLTENLQRVDLSYLRELLFAGFIIRTNEGFRFAHDRIKQAAYSLLSLSEKQNHHLTIAKHMLTAQSNQEITPNIFELCNHLSFAKDFFSDPVEKKNIASCYLKAAQQAKSSAAFESSYHYSAQGIALLEDSSWESDYQLTLSLFNEAIEAAYIVSKKDEMKRLSEILLDKVTSPLDQLKAFEINILYNTTESNLEEALNLSLTILKRLGMPFPHSPGKGKLIYQFLKTRWTLRNKKTSDLKNLPIMSDPMILAAMRVMMMATSAFYMSKPKLVIYMVLRIVELSVKYGCSNLTPFSLMSYSVVLSSQFHNKELSQQYTQLALDLLDKPENHLEWPRVYSGYNFFLRHWHEPIKNTLPSLLEVYQKMLDQGNIEFISMSVFLYSLHLLFSGENLQFVESETTKYHQIIHKYQSKLYIISSGLHMQVTSILRGKTDNPLSLTGEYFNEEKELSEISRDSDHTRAARYYTFKM